MKSIAILFTVGLGLVLSLIGLIGLFLSVYGSILAFKASFIFGIIVLLFEPAPLLIGLVAFLGNPDVAYKIALWVGLN